MIENFIAVSPDQYPFLFTHTFYPPLARGFAAGFDNLDERRGFEKLFLEVLLHGKGLVSFWRGNQEGVARKILAR